MQPSEIHTAPSDEGIEERMLDGLSAELRKLAIKAPERCTLPDILGQKSLIALNALAKLHGLKGYRKMAKSSMIMGLIPLLTNPSKLRKHLCTLDEEGWAFFQQICARGPMRANGESTPCVLLLCNVGVIYPYEDEEEHGGLTFVAPEEIRALYDRIVTPG